MSYSFRYKITLLLCRLFGHRFKDETAWEFHGKILDTCTRCNRIINVDGGCKMSTRWKPEIGDSYWSIRVRSGGAYVVEFAWIADVTDSINYADGNCFKTKKKAKEALEKVKQVLMEVHDEIN